MVSTFEHALAIEMLESQALRTLALGLLFAAATVFLCFLEFFFYDRYGRLELAPLRALLVVAGITAYEFGMLRMIKGRARHGRPIPLWRWYANAGIEITAMSAVILLVQGALSNPVYALGTPPVLGYVLFIILSTLYLDVRLSLFTGTLAAVQYLGIVLLIFSNVAPDPAHDAVFLTPGLYVGKALILLLAGAGAGFVAHELSRRQRLSLKAVEDRDREHRANTLKSQFLADMSHEIRTPLNAVLGYAQLLETDPDVTTEQRKAVEALGVGGRHLLAVVNDVLDLSKIEAGGEDVASSRFDLTVLLQELTLIFAARCTEKRLSWIFDMTAAGGDVAGDEAKLRQVLTNLLGNAVKFTSGGHVALRVSADEGGRYRFEVEDTGPGIPQDQQAIIFDPFAQDVHGRIEGGTGLGLAISHRYVALMGGELTVDSAPGNGSRFRFALPLPPAGPLPVAAATAPRTPAVRLAPGHAVRAAVVDDTPENRDVLTRMLTRAGVAVEEATGGATGLELLARRTFDIVFLDIRMPGVDGTEVFRRAAGRGDEGPRFVAVSASALAHEREAHLAAGFDDFLEKPVQMTALYGCISRLLGVAFEPASPAEVPAIAEPTPAVVPEALRRSLAEAARRHNVTELKRAMAALEALGEAERAFAERLRRLCARYDMTAIGRLLEALDGA